jgi:hypothetical protein
MSWIHAASVEEDDGIARTACKLAILMILASRSEVTFLCLMLSSITYFNSIALNSSCWKGITFL